MAKPEFDLTTISNHLTAAPLKYMIYKNTAVWGDPQTGFYWEDRYDETTICVNSQNGCYWEVRNRLPFREIHKIMVVIGRLDIVRLHLREIHKMAVIGRLDIVRLHFR